MNQNQYPNAVDSEAATLGAILIDPACFPDIDQLLQPEHFYIQKHRWIFAALRELHHTQTPIDLLLLSEALAQHGHLETVGGMAYLAQLSQHVPSAMNVAHYAKAVREAHQKRLALELAGELSQAAYNDSNGQFQKSLLLIQSQLAELLPPTPATAEPEAAAIPPLPFALETSTAGQWLDTYTAYAGRVSPMTPPRFHQSAALWLVSSIVARRLVIPMDFAKIYPNLWIAWVARSTIFGKSTSMDLARDMAIKAAPHLLTPEDMTPEGLIMDMSGQEPANLLQMRMDDQQSWTERRNFSAQRAWTMDEFSGLLASSGKDYNAGLIEILLRFYDCTPKYDRLTAGRGLQCIHNAYLTLLAASTPTAMAQHLTSDRLWGMGWWPRFSILVPDTARPEWALAQPPGDHGPITTPLKELYQRLPRPRWPDPLSDLPVLLGAGVFPVWSAYNKALRYDLLNPELDESLWAAYGRLPVHALKIAALIAALDWEDTPAPRIEAPHMYRALAIAEDWRICLHRALNLAHHEAADKLKQSVLYQISRQDPVGVTLRDLYKALKNKKPAEIERALDELLTQGEIFSLEVGSSKGGPKTTRYVLNKQ